MSLWLGVDVGTQGTKALVWDDATRAVVGRGAVSYDLLDVGRPGAAEQRPEDWIQAVKDAVGAACADVDRAAIRGVGVSGQQHGFVALDANGKPIRPAKLWCDTETAPEAADLSDRLERVVPAGFTASKVMWLERHEPENFERLHTTLLPHDWINYWLTGRAVMECGDASGTGWFDPERRQFDDAAVAAVSPKLAETLPELVGHSEPIGTLRAEVAEELGLSTDVVVAPGGGDNMMSAIGAGAVTPGAVVLSLGTSGTIFGRTDHAVVDPEGLVAPFCDSAGGWLPLLCTMNCTTVVEEVRTAFGGGDHATLTEAAAAEPAGCDGLTYLPYLAGERSPDWPHASGVLHGLRPGSMRRSLLYRAALEGATFALAQGFQHMRGLGVEADALRVVGGGAANPLWRRILADAFQLPLVFPSEPESAALGGAVQAFAVAGGGDFAATLREVGSPMSEERIEPDGAAAATYREALARFTSLGFGLFG